MGGTPRTDSIPCPPHFTHQRTSPSCTRELNPTCAARVSSFFLLSKCLFSVFKDTLTRHVELTSFINIHLPQFGKIRAEEGCTFWHSSLLSFLFFSFAFRNGVLVFFLPLFPADEETHPHTQNNSFQEPSNFARSSQERSKPTDITYKKKNKGEKEKEKREYPKHDARR